MVAEHGIDVGRGCVHEVAAGPPTDVDVDQAGRDVQPAGVDALGLRRDQPGRIRAHLLDPARLGDQHAAGDHATVGDDRAVVEDLNIWAHGYLFHETTRSAGESP